MADAQNDFAASGTNPTQSARGGERITGDMTLDKTSRVIYSFLGTSVMTLHMSDDTILTSYPLRAGDNIRQVKSVSDVSIGAGDYVAAFW